MYGTTIKIFRLDVFTLMFFSCETSEIKKVISLSNCNVNAYNIHMQVLAEFSFSQIQIVLSFKDHFYQPTLP